MLGSVFQLAGRSLLSRWSSVFLSIIAVAVSVALFSAVEKIRTNARASFESTISGVDAIVGGRTGPVNLLLFSVFRIGDATSQMSWQSVNAVERRPDVEWVIPISLGDSHKGYRVLGTTQTYFSKMRYGQQQSLSFSSGTAFSNHSDGVVVGSEVAKKLNYSVNDKIVVSHGTGEVSFHNHDAHPLVIVGVLNPTGTPIDRTVHVSLNTISRIHQSNKHHPEDHHDHFEAPSHVTAIFVGLKSRAGAPRFVREVNTYPKEPLTGIRPALTLSDLWQVIGVVENILSVISSFVITVGIVTILISIMTSLNARRREMAILRAVGARAFHIITLIVSEAAIISIIGSTLGIVIVQAGLAVATPFLSHQFGVMLSPTPPDLLDLAIISIVTAIACLLSFWPAYRALRTALSDGLSVSV